MCIRDRTIREQLAQLLDEFSSPLTVRSSSVLEDNLRYSFAGKYLTIFVTNNGTREERLAELEQAVKLVFASIYSPNAVEYRRKHGLHGDKMAVMIQQLSLIHISLGLPPYSESSSVRANCYGGSRLPSSGCYCGTSSLR